MGLGALVNIAIWLLSLFGFGKKDERDTEREAGERAGAAEQKAADSKATIERQADVIKTQEVMGDVQPVADDDAIARLRDGRG